MIEDLRYKVGTRAPLIDDDNAPRVRVMTLHGAKGLEEETVVVAGLADEIVPGIKLKNPIQDAAHVAEERRLLYVAVTRAKRELVLSWSLAIRNAETFPNGIVRKRFAFNRNGVVHTRMTRTTFCRRSRPSGRSRMAADANRGSEGGAGGNDLRESERLQRNAQASPPLVNLFNRALLNVRYAGTYFGAGDFISLPHGSSPLVSATKIGFVATFRRTRRE